MRYLVVALFLALPLSCASRQTLKPKAKTRPTNDYKVVAETVVEPERERSSGFSFVLPDGFSKKGEMYFVSTSTTTFRNIRVTQELSPFPKLSEKVCTQMAQLFVKQTGGKLVEQTRLQEHNHPSCRYVLRNDEFQFANVVTLYAPFVVVVSVISDNKAEEILDSMMQSWRVEPVTFMRGSFFEFPVPDDYVPFPNALKPPAKTLVRKERVRWKSFLGNIAIMPSEETSLVYPSTDEACHALGTTIGTPRFSNLKSAKMRTINSKSICSLESVSGNEANHWMRRFLLPAGTHGVLIVTCNYDPQDTKSVNGCETFVKTIKIDS
jgi:hypothetical protein